MSTFGRLAIIGVGPSAIYLLKHLLNNVQHFLPSLTDIYLFDKRARLGIGMPYDRSTTDEYNLCNISSAEIPHLDQTLVEWLHSLSDSQLVFYRIERSEIDEDETYCRTTLGDYFHQQYVCIATALRRKGLTLHEHPACEVTDVVDDRARDCVEILFGKDQRVPVDRIVIATGHSFPQSDTADSGYYSSPWPIQKLLPKNGDFYNFEIGTLGASLSAFDVVSSLSHRHGKFVQLKNRLIYQPRPGADGFKIVLHSIQGWLPHLQYEQVETFRKIYRHVDRDRMLALRDDCGFLSLDAYFNRVCRPALTNAFQKDGRDDIVSMLSDENVSFEELVATLSDEHTANDPFSLMRAEMVEAERSLRKGLPIHWKETLDDLMFTLNFHYDLLPAEDHLRYRRTIVPFLMNVVAAMPLHSANVLLALHDAGRLELTAGTVTVQEKSGGRTLVEISNDDGTMLREYRMFIECGGQGSLNFHSFPFPSMTADGTVSEALVHFRNASAADRLDESETRNLLQHNGRRSLRVGGIAIDGFYRVVGEDGRANNRIHDIAFPHATGIRPYSYGLQACETAASVVVQSWCEESITGRNPSARAQEVTEVYNDLADPSQPAA